MNGHCNFYSYGSGKHLIGYTKSSKPFKFPKDYPIALVISDVKPSNYPDVKIINLDELFTTNNTPDKQLFKEHIYSFNDLYYCQYLAKLGIFRKSENIQQLVLNKYADIMNYEY